MPTILHSTRRRALSPYEASATVKLPRPLFDAIDAYADAEFCGRAERGMARQFRRPDVVQSLLRKQEQDGDTLESAKRKERAAMARRREIEADRLEGRLVDIAEIEATITDQIQKLQSELLAIPV